MFESFKLWFWFSIKFQVQESQVSLAVVIFQFFVCFKIGSWFLLKQFRVKLAQVSKIGFKVLVKVLVSRRFHFAQFVFYGLPSLWSSQVSEIGFKIFSKSFGKFGSGFFARLIFSGKAIFSKVSFQHRF